MHSLKRSLRSIAKQTSSLREVKTESEGTQNVEYNPSLYNCGYTATINTLEQS